MWGDPHISVGRRVERPIQCRKVAEGSQVDRPSLCLSRDDSYLAAFVAGAVGKKSVVVTPCARCADADLLHSRLRRMLSDERPEINVTWTGGRLTRQLLPNFGAHLIAAPADRGSEVDRQLVRS